MARHPHQPPRASGDFHGPAGRAAVTVVAVLATALLAVVGTNSTRWIGRSFPGFFVMANRVIASVALPGGPGGEPSRLFQHEVRAVDGVPVTSAADVYERVRARPVGSPIQYTLRAADGTDHVVVVPSRRFGTADYVSLFGAYLLNGLVFTGVGLLVYVLRPRSAASAGLLAAGLATGLFVITAADLYGPHWFFRLHVLGESVLAASFIHLALVFPTDRLRGRRRLLAAVYGPFLALAIVYETVLGTPAVYTAVHLLATGAHALAAGVIVAAVAYDFVMTRSAQVRRQIGVVIMGTLAGILLPGVLMAGSTLSGGHLAINAGALTAFLFPLSLGYAVVRRDVLAFDLVFQRGFAGVLLAFAGASHFLLALLDR